MKYCFIYTEWISIIEHEYEHELKKNNYYEEKGRYNYLYYFIL